MNHQHVVDAESVNDNNHGVFFYLPYFMQGRSDLITDVNSASYCSCSEEMLHRFSDSSINTIYFYFFYHTDKILFP